MLSTLEIPVNGEAGEVSSATSRLYGGLEGAQELGWSVANAMI